ncbi:MAG: GNAT family N-acetyltransferase [Bryobacteraceae bacterium]|nr:GNAT family N-acetyltransferase [Bryobacteraceae bacterium]
MRESLQLKLEVRELEGAEAFATYYDLRWRVLREPWAQLRESERDEHEADAIHLGCWLSGRLIGVGRLHFNSAEEAQIRYMAVEPGFAGRGVGGTLLRELERRAAESGAARVVLDARESANGFYEKHGYRILGFAGLLFDQIPHWKMAKDVGSCKTGLPAGPAFFA